MATPFEVADAHQRRVIRRVESAAQQGLKLWGQMDPQNLDASWLSVGPAVAELTTNAQRANAVDAEKYIASAASVQGARSGRVRLTPEALSGVDASGRDVEGLLHGAVTTTKEQIGKGLSLPNAMLTGASYLTAMLKTAVADLARSSQLVGATGKGWTLYVRVVNPGACSRCAMLAGKQSYSKPFLRHPACKCTSWPIDGDNSSDVPAGLFSTPDDYFDSLSKAEQDRVFTNAGAEAIRQGADVSRVVSARRNARGLSYGGRETRQVRGRLERQVIGTRPDGTPITVFTTGEGTTSRGQFGKANIRLGVGMEKVGTARYTSTKRIRVMPETLIDVAGGDPNAARVLLRDAGYIEPDYGRLSPQQIADQQRSDRVWADRLYRQAGFTL